MMQKASSNIEEVPYCFSMSPVKSQGHTGQKITELDPNAAFPDCNSSLRNDSETRETVLLESSNTSNTSNTTLGI